MEKGLFLIYARANNGVIGKDNALPWYLPADLKRFKSLTMGKPMLMGRKTFESLPGLLPGRKHIVLTHQKNWARDGVEVANNVQDALALARKHRMGAEVAVIGGAKIYETMLPLAERIELTAIHADYDGDTFIEPVSSDWELTKREDFKPEGAEPSYSFMTYQRAKNALA